MDTYEKDIATLKWYLRTKGYRVGQGKVFDIITKIITEDGHDANLKHLNAVLSDPRQAAALLGLMVDDMGGEKAHRRTKKKVRRGIGSY